jgi:hypothetical protein
MLDWFWVLEEWQQWAVGIIAAQCVFALWAEWYDERHPHDEHPHDEEWNND